MIIAFVPFIFVAVFLTLYAIHAHFVRVRYEKEKYEREQRELRRKRQQEALLAQYAKEREEAQRRHKAEQEQKRRAQIKQSSYIAAQRRLLSDSMRYDVLRRDKFRCVLCGATAADGVRLHVDHVVPLAKGGKTEMSNLRTLCERCNLGKGVKLEK